MRAKQRGLTLIELLVAISILSLIAVMGWRGLDSIVRTRSALSIELEQTRGMQIAFAQLQNDSAQFVASTAVQNRNTFNASANKLTFVRNVYAEQQATRVQVISYRITDGKLTRRESAATRDLNELDKLWLAALNDSDNSPAVILQNGIASMSARVWLNGLWQDTVNLPIPSSPNGLEIILMLPQQATGLSKTFLLGAV